MILHYIILEGGKKNHRFNHCFKAVIKAVILFFVQASLLGVVFGLILVTGLAKLETFSKKLSPVSSRLKAGKNMCEKLGGV
ncbi:hypothetical protein KC845_02280 [Candidatus Kaiserbacteria bacterium]|nr:hypothetical protein [Candidatus Kaiserbacteria bacterium]